MARETFERPFENRNLRAYPTAPQKSDPAGARPSLSIRNVLRLHCRVLSCSNSKTVFPTAIVLPSCFIFHNPWTIVVVDFENEIRAENRDASTILNRSKLVRLIIRSIAENETTESDSAHNRETVRLQFAGINSRILGEKAAKPADCFGFEFRLGDSICSSMRSTREFR